MIWFLVCLVLKKLILKIIIKKLIIRGNKLNISLVFITQFYFAVSKNIRLNATHYTKIPNKRKLQQIAFNHSLDIDFQDYMNLYRKCTTEPYSFLVINTTLTSDNILHFRKNLAQRIKKKRKIAIWY